MDAAARATEDGYVILERAIEPALVAELTSAIDRRMTELAVPFGANDFVGTRTRRLFNLLARDPLFARVPVHEAVLSVVERVLDPECLLSSLTAIEMHPGETAQPLHTDDGSIPLPKPHVPITCTAIWALTDFTQENGGTRIVSGSHKGRSPRRGDGPETRTTVMPAGSVLIYHGSLGHGGDANRGAARRLAIICNFCAGWVRQEECQLLALPREQVAGFPPRLQGLVGYGTYRGLLGHVDQQSPAEWVNPDVTTDMVWRRIRS